MLLPASSLYRSMHCLRKPVISYSTMVTGSAMHLPFSWISSSRNVKPCALAAFLAFDLSRIFLTAATDGSFMLSSTKYVDPVHQKGTVPYMVPLQGVSSTFFRVYIIGTPTWMCWYELKTEHFWGQFFNQVHWIISPKWSIYGILTYIYHIYISQMYQHLQRGAKWFLKGVNSPSLRV